MSIKRVLLAVSLLLMCGLAPASAQQAPTTSGLSISPTRVEFSLKPGQGDKIDINLKNVTSGDIIAKPVVNDFESDNATGDPKVIVDTNIKSPNSLRDYILNLDDVPLAKGEQKKVTLLVQMPANIPAGGYFGIIRYQAVPANSANGAGNDVVALSASVGTIVLVEVPGNITEKVELQAVKVYSGTKASSFFLKPPTDIGIQVKNLGNSFAKPFGKITVRNMFGTQVLSYEVNNNTPRSNVLPGSTRVFKDGIKHLSLPGRYTALANIAYGHGSDVLIGKATFWYLPSWTIIILLVILALLVIGLWLAYRRYFKATRRSRRR